MWAEAARNYRPCSRLGRSSPENFSLAACLTSLAGNSTLGAALAQGPRDPVPSVLTLAERISLLEVVP